MRRIAIMIGSDSDLPQCRKGLEFLAQMAVEGKAEVVEVITASIHRNTEFVLEKLRSLVGKIDVLVAAAGWANALTGIADAFFRNALGDNKIVVVGGAFEDPKDEIHTLTARLSISEVPGSQIVFNDSAGSKGFLEACRVAVEKELPKIKIPSPSPPVERTLEEALTEAQKMKGETNGIRTA